MKQTLLCALPDFQTLRRPWSMFISSKICVLTLTDTKGLGFFSYFSCLSLSLSLSHSAFAMFNF